MDMSLESLLDPIWWYFSKGLPRGMGKGRLFSLIVLSLLRPDPFPASEARETTGHIRLPQKQRLKVYRYPRMTDGTPHVSYQLLHAVLLYAHRLGSHIRIQTQQESTPLIVEPWSTPSVFKNVAILFILYSLACSPNDSLCRIPTRSSLARKMSRPCEDGYTAWVKADSASVMERHIVNVSSANPAFHEAPDRKHSPTNEEYRFETDVPNRLTEQERLSIYIWNTGPRRGREEAIEKHIAGKWHINHPARIK